MAHHEPAAHVSPDKEYRETPPGAAHEYTDANVWLIAKFLWWLAVSAVIVHFGLGLFYQLLIQRSLEVGEPPYPLAVAQEQRLPPTPRLQQFPHNELYEFRLSEEELLQRYGWMNKNAGTVHIPIAEAMRLTVERGLPSRAPEAAPPAATPGMMPSDASSGRTMERRRQ